MEEDGGRLVEIIGGGMKEGMEGKGGRRGEVIWLRGGGERSGLVGKKGRFMGIDRNSERGMFWEWLRERRKVGMWEEVRGREDKMRR